MNVLIQALWMILAIAAIVVFARRLRALASAKYAQATATQNHADATKRVGDNFYNLNGMIRDTVKAMEEEEEARRASAMVEAARNIILQNWPEEKRDGWKMAPGSPFLQFSEDKNKIRISREDPEILYEISVQTEGRMITIDTEGSCDLLRALGEHDEEDHEEGMGCSATIYAYQGVERALEEIGKFLTKYPQGLPLPAAAEIGEETLVEERVIERGPGGLL